MAAAQASNLCQRFEPIGARSESFRYAGGAGRRRGPREGVRAVAADGIRTGDDVEEAHGRLKGILEEADFARIADAQIDVIVKHEHFPDLPRV